MSQTLNLNTIVLEQIDFNDASFSISPERVVPDDTLMRSVARYGILHPPVVREKEPGVYAIVAGRKRLLALKAGDTGKTCACLVVSRQVPEAEVFHVLLAETRLTRELTAAEKAILLRKTAEIADESQLIKEFLPCLNLAPHSFALQQTLKLLDLEEPIFCAMHHGQISETVGHELVSLPPPDRMALFRTMTSLRLSFSNQKKLLYMCRELASRDNTSIAALLDTGEVHEILQHPEANPPQKTKNLMHWLHRKHMPRSTRAAAEFSRFVADLQLPPHVTVTHTPSFEDDTITLSISFPDRKSLQNTWKQIKHAKHDSGN